MTGFPVLAVAFVAVLPPLLTLGASTWHHRPNAARRALSFAAWILAGVAPLLTMMFVAPDLQGSRYLYLPSAAWSLFIADLLPIGLWPRDALMKAIAGALLIACVIATRAHVAHWVVAGQLRDAALARIKNQLQSCGNNRLTVPQHYRGAYVFVNGLSEALQLNGVTATAGPSGSANASGCVITPTADGDFGSFERGR
jgi:hypothetical protein